MTRKPETSLSSIHSRKERIRFCHILTAQYVYKNYFSKLLKIDLFFIFIGSLWTIHDFIQTTCYSNKILEYGTYFFSSRANSSYSYLIELINVNIIDVMIEHML